MKRIVVLALLSLAAVGCGGEAQVTLVNNTSRYVTGNIDGSSFGIVSGSTSLRSVSTGGFFSSSKKISIYSYAHQSYDAASPIVANRVDQMKVDADHTYTYEIYFITTSNTVGLRLLHDGVRGSLTGP